MTLKKKYDLSRMRCAGLLLLLSVLLLSGCSAGDGRKSSGGTEAGSKTEAGTDPEGFDGYRFTCSSPATGEDVSLYAGRSPEEALELLGDPLSFYEAESCALPGSDQIYTYSGFELTVNSDTENILISIRLTDDSFTTEEGIYIGSSVKQMLAAYGDSTPVSGEYLYEKGDTELAFLTHKEVVTSIEYRIR